MGVSSLNHDTTTSCRLSRTPFPLKFTPTCTWYYSIRVYPYAHPQNLKVLNRECLREGDSETSRDKLMKSKWNPSEHEQGTWRENLHHMVKTTEDL
jgi:hypothetical protein